MTAVHNHINEMSPHVMYMHYEGRGDGVQLPKALRQALAASGTPLGTPVSPAAAETSSLDTKEIERVLGRTGREVGAGVFQVSLPRAEAITESGVLAGETSDLIIGSTLSMAPLVRDGKIEQSSQLTICRVGVGIVVPAGTPKPNVVSLDDLKRALLAAKTIIYADPRRGGAAGVHVAGVIDKLGIAKQLEAKTKLAAGGVTSRRSPLLKVTGRSG